MLLRNRYRRNSKKSILKSEFKFYFSKSQQQEKMNILNNWNSYYYFYFYTRDKIGSAM